MPPTRIALRNDLDQLLAVRVARPAVDRLKEEVQREARQRAPAGKAWLTYEDERVRPAHADADMQTIPGNLRYQLRKQVYIRGRRRRGDQPSVPGITRLLPEASGFDLAKEPRDGSLPIDQKANCRCESVDLPGAVARSIQAGPTQASGTRVTADVYTRFNRAAESEFGTAQDPGAYFMTGALRAVGVRLRATSRPLGPSG